MPWTGARPDARGLWSLPLGARKRQFRRICLAMNIQPISTKAAETDADAIVVGIYSKRPLTGAAAEIDAATGGLIRRLVERQEIVGKPYELTPLHGPSGVRAPLVLIVGCGETEGFDRGMAYRVSAAAARQLAARRRNRVAFYLDLPAQPQLLEAAVAGAIVGSQGADLYRAEKNRHPFGTLLWASAASGPLESGRIMGESINLTRELVNQPPDDMYPESFAARAASVGLEAGLQTEIWDLARLQTERCGSLLAVAKGSSREPRLVILRYRGGPTDQAPLALVGKGVTFDSGGLSIKPSDGMLYMKCDMAGAATVLGAMQAIARLKLPLNVIGLAGLVENMTGPAAMKLGDVLRARNDRTIEVHNTDAEGRLVLADVLSVAVDAGASRIVDLATLTGACVVALGNDVAGMMTNDEAWCSEIAGAARACGEFAWQLPMYPFYRDQINSEVADIKNMGDGRAGGAITAAKFLEEFVAGKPWTHIDIAGPAFLEKPKPWQDAGGTGAFVRTLVELARVVAKTPA